MIAVIILTFNEEIHIARAIESVKPFSAEIWVVDSHSTDQTQSIAKAMGAKVIQHQFTNQAAQLNWALDNLPIQSDWIMRLDADEIISDELSRELNFRLPGLASDVHGVELNRKHIFLGRWIRFGGRFPMKLLRIWRKGSARSEERWMDEHIALTKGNSVQFAGTFSDWNLNDLSFFISKHNSYATREAVEVIGQRLGLLHRNSQKGQLYGAPAQAKRKKFIKANIYNRIPFPFSSTAYFFLRYFLQLGFLDGIEGLIYHFQQGFWYRFLVGCKIYEFERLLRGKSSDEELRQELARISGLPL